MDIQLPKKPWYVKYRMYLLGAIMLLSLMIYVVHLQLRPRTLKAEVRDGEMAVACDSDFLEYVDVNGLVVPLTTRRVNAVEGGTVERICCHNGDLLKRGDTILVLSNPKVLEEMTDERRNYEMQQLTHRRQLVEMQQKSITLRQQVLQADFELRKMQKDFELAQEEHQMGVKSKAQLEVAREEYEYNRRRTLLTIEGLRHDSVLNAISRRLIEQQMSMEQQRLAQSNGRWDALVVLAPVDGQIANLNAIIGGQVTAGEQVGEIGVLEGYKVTARLNEYYIDRIQTGQRATAVHKGRCIPLQVSRITPQVQEHSFAVELQALQATGGIAATRRSEGPAADATGTVTGRRGGRMTAEATGMPALPIGLTLRLQIELGRPERRLVIPRGSFYAQTGGQWILRVDAKNPCRARRVPVRLGRQNAEFYEVLEGLNAGDRVLIGGYDRFGDAEVVEW